MKFLRDFCRYAVGLLFVFSAVVKAVDPVGVGLKVKEYLHVYGGLDFGKFTIVLAVGLCIVEFLCGVALLCRIKVRLFSLVALLLTLFFTVVTFLSAKYDLVRDCGCFGDALKLSAWGTFYKNLLLIVLCMVVYLGRKRYTAWLSNLGEWLAILLFATLLVIFALYCYRYLPVADFTDFKPETNLVEASEGNTLKYKTEVVYEKDGVKEKFTLDALPDSTWNFVETISTLVEGSELNASKSKFILKDDMGNNVTSEALLQFERIALVSIYDLEMNAGKRQKIGEIVENFCTNSNSPKLKDIDAVYIVSAFTPEQTGELLSSLDLPSLSDSLESGKIKVFYSDYKTLITLNRSNGGITIVKNGVVEKKYSLYSL